MEPRDHQNIQNAMEHPQNLQESAYIISSLSSMFCSTYYADLESDTFQVVTQISRVGTVLGDKVNCTAALQVYAENFIHPDDRAGYLATMNVERLRRVLGWWNPYEVYEYRKLPEGDTEKQGWIRATAVLARSDTQGRPKIVLYVAQDVTESKRKEAQQMLKDARALASQAGAAKSQLLSRMGHDMRAPLNAIIEETAIAAAHLQDADRVQDCLDKIARSGQQLLSLVNGVPDMERSPTE